MMHAGSDNPREANPFGGIDNKRFTNILRDTQANPTNFFDTSREDNGVCRTRNQGGLVTYNSSWSPITRDGLAGSPPQSLRAGGVKVGDGHHFASENREGSCLSNARHSDCEGSESDTIFWAWIDDAHGCSNSLRLGTGCARMNTGGRTGTPTYRYNYLFMH